MLGAKAKIYIKYDGELKEVGKIISKGSQIPDFWFKNDTEPPYNSTAMSEAFGFESWLSRTNSKTWKYKFEISTMHNRVETGKTQKYDLSLWLKEYVINICKIDAITESEKNALQHYV
ncbi:hypothetical protein N9B82_03725 [Saprospiraceae bacterium]|nr:hypothetical protein [Saprospiraceae bacterium]